MEVPNNSESVRVSEVDTRDFQMFGFKLNINKTYHAYDDAYNTHNTYDTYGGPAYSHPDFHPLEIVSRYRDPQLQVVGNSHPKTADQRVRDSAHKYKYLPAKKAAFAFTHSTVQQ